MYLRRIYHRYDLHTHPTSSIHSTVAGHCGGVLTIVSNGAMNTGVQVSFQYPFAFPLDIYAVVGLLGRMVIPFSIF